MHNIIEQENEFFAKWRQDLPLLCPDGIFDERAYLNSFPKILFVLKEPHSKDQTDHFDLREIVRDGRYHQTWTNIVRWAKALRLISQNGQDNVTAKKLEVADQETRKTELKNICVMNLKKRVGRASTDMRTLKKFIDDQVNYELYFRKQFDLYNPDIVICCGSGVAETLRNILVIPNEWASTKRGLWYYLSNSPHLLKKNTPILSWVHPQLRGAMRWPLATFPLVDAWGELSKL